MQAVDSSLIVVLDEESEKSYKDRRLQLWFDIRYVWHLVEGCVLLLCGDYRVFDRLSVRKLGMLSVGGLVLR